MKRLFLPLLACLIFALLCSCSGSQTISESGTWLLEYVSDKDGNIIAAGPNYDGLDDSKLDLSYIFDGKKFEVTNAGQVISSGIFKKKQSDDTLTLSLEYDNGSTASAVCEVMPDASESSQLSMTLETNENIFVFVKV